MVVCDYVLANMDRHLGNWGFLVDNSTQEIASFAPLYDMNQVLITDQMHDALDELVYQPTDTTYREAVGRYAPFSSVDFGRVADLPEKCEERWEKIQEFQRECSFFSEPSRMDLEAFARKEPPEEAYTMVSGARAENTDCEREAGAPKMEEIRGDMESTPGKPER